MVRVANRSADTGVQTEGSRGDPLFKSRSDDV